MVKPGVHVLHSLFRPGAVVVLGRYLRLVPAEDLAPPTLQQRSGFCRRTRAVIHQCSMLFLCGAEMKMDRQRGALYTGLYHVLRLLDKLEAGSVWDVVEDICRHKDFLFDCPALKIFRHGGLLLARAPLPF